MFCSKKDIGERLTKLRKSRDLTQDELSAALHVSREVVAKWENGSRDIKTEYLVAIADFYGITCDGILRGIKAENVNISNELGLSDGAIDGLKSIYHSSVSTGRDTIKIINLLLENEENYFIFRAIMYYLANFSRPKHQLDPDVSYLGQRNSEQYIEWLDTHIEVYDEQTGSLHQIPYEDINGIYLLKLQIQLSKLKDALQGSSGLVSK